MSDKAIEILIRLRAETAEKNLASMAAAAQRADKSISGVDKEAAKAERALKKMGDGARDSEKGLNAMDRGINKMRSAVGGSGLVNDLSDVADGIDAIGIGGAAAVVGLGAMTAAATKLGTEMIAIMRDVDQLAPKFESLAGQEIISQQSIEASHSVTANLDKLWSTLDAMVGVLVDGWAPAMASTISYLNQAATVALNLYKIFEKITTSGFAGDMEGIGAALFGNKYDSRAANPTSGTGGGGGYTIGAMGRINDPGRSGAATGDFSSLTAGAAKIAEKAARDKASRDSAARAAASAAKASTVTGPSSAGFGQIDFNVDDIAVTTMTRIQQDIVAAMKDAPPPPTDTFRALGEQIAEFSYGAAAEAAAAANKAGKLGATSGKAVNAMGKIQGAIGGGVQGAASAISMAGPIGAIIGAAISLGDTIRNMGAEGLSNLAASIEDIPIALLNMLPEILTTAIPNSISKGVPALVEGIFKALPKLFKALMVDGMAMMVKALYTMFRKLWQDIKEVFTIKNEDKARERDGSRNRGALDVLTLGFSAGVRGIMRSNRGNDAYVDPSTGPRSGGGSTARTSAPDGGGSEQHVHVHIGTHVGTDAKSARELARMLRSHMGTRGTGLALE